MIEFLDIPNYISTVCMESERKVSMAAGPLETIMNPTSISMAGASNNLRKMGTIQLINLIDSGFGGEIMPIHPKESEVLGKKAYRTVSELPYAPDLAILVVPTAVVPGMLEEFGKIGTRHAIIITAGFRETGEKGRELEKRIIEIADAYGIRFLGPNCLGIVNTHLPLNVTVAPILRYGGGFSLASQSGTYIAQSVQFLQRNGIAMGKAISGATRRTSRSPTAWNISARTSIQRPSASISRASATPGDFLTLPGKSAGASPSWPSMWEVPRQGRAPGPAIPAPWRDRIMSMTGSSSRPASSV